MGRALVHRPGFTTDLLKFDAPSIKQILDKCTMLQESPEPGGKAKARLDGRYDGLHRLRTGKFRIFYTYDDEKISLWGVRRKTVKGEYRGKKGGDVTYDGIDDVEDTDLDLDIPEFAPRPDFDTWMQPTQVTTPLPEPITVELLTALDVPNAFHARLLRIEDQDALLECPGVPEEHLLAIDRHMFEEPISLRANEPELYATGGVDDLLRFTEGKVVPFLLRLSPQQEQFVTWARDATGPTLVRGGPGTGKSTVALYRVRTMIDALRHSGTERPSILFTTYTNALVTFSKQLLAEILGDDVELVDVRTADSLVGTIVGRTGTGGQRPNASQRETCRTAALEAVTTQGNVLQRSVRAEVIERLGRSYLFEEIETVVQARVILSVEDYLDAPRPGRRVPLRQKDRRVVWAVAEAYADALQESGYQTWQQARSEAARLAAENADSVPRYDAVVVDEAQDLDASALRMLVEVCAAPNRLFVTADASQSIYAAGFSWQAVHEDLRFRGRTGILRANYRTTQQISEAAARYLASGLPDELAPDPQTYVHEGPLPAVRSNETLDDEAQLMARYLRGATRALRLTIGSSAVLVPDRYVGEDLAQALDGLGIPAVYRDSRHFELDDNTVSVMPLVAAKGLEFPVVAVGGFERSNWPHIQDDWDDDAMWEAIIRARRTLYVAMTRAMRALLFLTPAMTDSLLFEGFDSSLWNTGE